MFHMPCRPPQMPTEIDGFPPFRRLATVLGLFGPILYHIYIYILAYYITYRRTNIIATYYYSLSQL